MPFSGAAGARLEAAVVAAQQPRVASVTSTVVAGLARHLLDARGRVDRIADDRELDAAAAADRAGDDRARVDADADAQLLAVALAHRQRDLDRRRDRAVGVLGERLRRAEDAEQPVADVLVGWPPWRTSSGTTSS